ncbi:MAG: radical SAM protein [Deltaproteobacteria bacterium]|nr:radical SAM protein [Deltaproteobacteria bacterium]
MPIRYLKTAKEMLARGTPGYLVFFVTPYCNCRCAMCFNARVVDEANRRKILTLEEIARIARNFPGLHYINFSGGEPFLREDLEHIPALFYRYSGTRFFTFTTNSSLPEITEAKLRAICESCPDSWIRINQSLDAIGPEHDLIRGKPGLFASVVDLNQRLSRLTRSHPNLSVGIVTVISRLNQGREYGLLDYLYQNLFFSDYGVLYARGETRDPAAREIDARAFVRFHGAVRSRAKRRPEQRGLSARLYTALHQTAGLLLIKVITEDRYVTPCQAGRRMLVIDDQGSVEPCEILKVLIRERKSSLESSDLGNLRAFDYDVRKLLTTDHSKRVLEHIIEHRCYCTYECAMAANVLYTPRLWPLVLKNFVSL